MVDVDAAAGGDKPIGVSREERTLFASLGKRSLWENRRDGDKHNFFS